MALPTTIPAPKAGTIPAGKKGQGRPNSYLPGEIAPVVPQDRPNTYPVELTPAGTYAPVDNASGITSFQQPLTPTTDTGYSSEPHVYTTQELFMGDKYALQAANMAVSRGISPSANWLWKLGGVQEKAAQSPGLSITLANGYSMSLGLNSLGNYDVTYTSPQGISYSQDEFDKLTADTGTKLSLGGYYSESADWNKLFADFLPDTTVAPKGSVPPAGAISYEDAQNTINKYAADHYDLLQLMGQVFPKEDAGALLEELNADPASFQQKLIKLPRADAVKILKTLDPSITEAKISETIGANQSGWATFWNGVKNFVNSFAEKSLEGLTHNTLSSVGLTQAYKVTGLIPNSAMKAANEKQYQAWQGKIDAVYQSEVKGHEDWLAKHPELMPKPEWTSPKFWESGNWHDANYWGWQLGQLAPTIAGVLVASVTMQPEIVAPVLMGTFAPSSTANAYDFAVAHGMSEQDANTLAAPVGLAVSAIMSYAKMPALKSISPAFGKAVEEETANEIARLAVQSAAKQGLKAFTQSEITMVMAGVVSQAIQNIAVKIAGGEINVTEGLTNAAIASALQGLPLSAIAAFGAVKQAQVTNRAIREMPKITDKLPIEVKSKLETATAEAAKTGDVAPIAEAIGKIKNLEVTPELKAELVDRGYDPGVVDTIPPKAAYEAFLTQAEAPVKVEPLTGKPSIRAEELSVNPITEPSYIPQSEVGSPEAGMQGGMFGEQVAVRPQGKGHIVQTSLEDAQQEAGNGPGTSASNLIPENTQPGRGPGSPRADFFTEKTGKSLEDLKIELAEYVKDNVPKNQQGKMLLDVAKVKTDSEFDQAVTKANSLAETVETHQYKAWLTKNGLSASIKPGQRLPVEPIKKLIKLIELAQPTRSMTESMKHEELSRRAEVLRSVLESTEGVDAYKKALASLEGELPQADYVLDLAGAGVTDADIGALFNAVRTSELREFQKLNTFKALDKILSGELPTTGELARLEKVFGTELSEALLKKMSPGKRIFEEIIGVLNLPRAILASLDNSFLLRQAGMMAWGNPHEALSAIGASFKAMFSEKNALAIQHNIESDPRFNLLQDSGVYQSPLPSATAAVKLTEIEEAFMTRLPEKIPVLKQLIGISERGYIMGLNKIRADVFYKWYDNNVARDPTMGEYKAIGNAINILTGRGNMGKYANHEITQLLSAAFFAPRYAVSRVEAPLLLFSKYASVRRMTARNLTSWFAANATFLGLIGLAGGTIEMDPRSSDFGKGKLGNLRLDFWAGEVQWARMIAQVISGERKNVDTGAVADANRLDTVEAFARSKYSPALGLITDLLKGQTAIGDEMTVANAPQMAYERLTPLFLQDMIDAVHDNGLAGGTEAVPGFFGVGVQVFGGDTWDGISGKMGQPKSSALPLSKENPLYLTSDYFSDVQAKIKDVSLEDIRKNAYFPELVKSVAEASAVKDKTDIMPNSVIYQINTDPNNGDTFAEFYSQWQERSRITDPVKLAAFDKQYPSAYKGNISRNQYNMFKEYSKLKTDDERTAYRKAHPEITVNPRESYLTAHPDENAQLALWGKARLYSEKAYNALLGLANSLDVPTSALPSYIPPANLAKSYWSWDTAVKQYGATSPEAKLIRAQNKDLQDWGDKTNISGFTPVTDNLLSLQIKVQFRQNYDMYEAFGDKNSPMYIAQDSARTKARDAYLTANPSFRDNKYLADGLDKGMSQSLAMLYVGYQKTALGSARLAYRRAHPELEAYLVNEEGYTPLK